MNETLYQKWIDALESGEYAPTSDYLRTSDNKFCCLGVLCDVYNPENWINNQYFNHDTILPPALTNELNLRTNLGHFHTKDLSHELQKILEPYINNRGTTKTNCSLTSLNDLAQDPFPLIAAVLREQPRSLFR